LLALRALRRALRRGRFPASHVPAAVALLQRLANEAEVEMRGLARPVNAPRSLPRPAG